MAAPAVSAAGSNGTAAAAVTVALPTQPPVVGDRAVIVIVHRDIAVGTPTPSDTAGFGPWTQVSGSPVVQGAARLTVWTAVVESTTPTAPVVSDSGDHQQVRCFYVNHPSGTPVIHATQASVHAIANTAGFAACPTTTVNDCAIVLCAACDTPDSNLTNEYSSVANPGLTSIVEKGNNAVQTGGGSAKLVASGVKAIAGTIVDWTYSKGTGGVKAHLVIAFAPPTTGTTFFGSLSMPITFGATISGGQRKTFAQTSLPITFGKAVAGRKQTFAQVAFPITVGIATAGFRVGLTLYGSVTLPIIFGKDVAGQRKALGQIAFPIVFSKDVRGQRKTFGQTLSPIIFGKAVAGRKQTFSQIVFPINAAISTAGIRLGTTRFGVVAFPVTFGKDVRGQRKTFSQVAFPVTFAKAVAGRRRTFGQITFPIIFIKEAVGRKSVFGQLSMQTLFGKEIAGRRKTFSQLTFPIAFSKAVAGRKQTFGRIALPINVPIYVAGYGWVGAQTVFGSLAMPLTFSKQVNGNRKTFGKTNSPFIFGSVSQGRRRTFSELELPIEFYASTESGPVGVYGLVELDLILTIDTAGKLKMFGVILNDALDLYLGEQNVDAVYVDSEQVWP